MQIVRASVIIGLLAALPPGVGWAQAPGSAAPAQSSQPTPGQAGTQPTETPQPLLERNNLLGIWAACARCWTSMACPSG